jgi:hypothetical protein
VLRLGRITLLSISEQIVKLKTLLICALLIVTASGCGMFTPTIQPHPDATRVVTGSFLGWVETAVYDVESNTLIPCGWESISDFNGWSMMKFDWEAHINSKK